MDHSDHDRNPVEVLAEEFAGRLRRGEHPTIDEYASRYTDLAEEIQEVFPSIAMIEELSRHEHAEVDRVQSRTLLNSKPLERLGDFRIIREIGRGGMGVVFEAEQESLDRRVAVKVLSASEMHSPTRLQRFLREAHAAASLHHTNIVPVFGVGEHEGLHYYVMQLIQGAGLDVVVAYLRQSGSPESPASKSDPSFVANAATMLRSGEILRWHSRRSQSDTWPTLAKTAAMTTATHSRPLSESIETTFHPDEAPSATDPDVAESRDRDHDEAVGAIKLDDSYWKSVACVGLQLADALYYAHGQGVLHRDIKPSNLLLDHNGAVWITDFGLAKRDEMDDVTKTGDLAGTLRYMAPEQFNGKGDARTDIYSLGVTLFELLTLRPAFEETKRGSLIRMITTTGPESPRKRCPTIPRDLETIVTKATASEPEARYQTAGELADDLQAFLDDRPIRARRATSVERAWRWARRNPALASSSAATLLLLALVAIVATVGNVRTNRALRDLRDERQITLSALERAETERNRAANESRRAEANLTLAVSALDKIMANISARGLPIALEWDLGEGDQPTPTTTVLTNADAELLQGLLSFFDEFACQNGGELHRERAEAYRKVGDIRQRLGQYDSALVAYREAEGIYDELTNMDATPETTVAQANILIQIGLVRDLAGDFHEARTAFQAAIDFLEGQPEAVRLHEEVRFKLAHACLSFASAPVGSSILSGGPKPPSRDKDRRHRSREFRSSDGSKRRFTQDSFAPPPADASEERRPRTPLAQGPPQSPPRDDRSVSPSPRPPWWLPLLGRYRREALAIVEELMAEDPGRPEYRLFLARCLLSSHHSSRFHGDYESARASLEEAISLLEHLSHDYPMEPRYRYELAETLLSCSGRRHSEESKELACDRISRAVAITNELTAAFPRIHEYSALLAGAQGRLASLYHRDDHWTAAEGHYLAAIGRLKPLASQFPEIALYGLALARFQLGYAELELDQGQYEIAQRRLETAIDDFRPYTRTMHENPFVRGMQKRLEHSLSRIARKMKRDEETVDSNPPKLPGESNSSSQPATRDVTKQETKS
ncbi:Serine/threonine-protein kinase pkn5 [Planctomycetes bacterium Pan216]|uniref:Serine/threonine-protein kinase pkn5 n=1 Tax=Kolteria novifilia TaxID=2527975 RepID=A0A518B4R4_9BACT|nr:Serine/threonine-protein kinase pkn5 [Planctomycetes bacterium Pan216]